MLFMCNAAAPGSCTSRNLRRVYREPFAKLDFWNADRRAQRAVGSSALLSCSISAPSHRIRVAASRFRHWVAHFLKN